MNYFSASKRIAVRKKIILTIAIGLSVFVKAQVANIFWKGNFNIPDLKVMLLRFKTDTLLLNYTDGSTLETMSYKIHNDTLSLCNLEGESECNYAGNATYKIAIKDKKLTFSALTEDCSVRVAAWPSEGLEKIEPAGGS